MVPERPVLAVLVNRAFLIALRYRSAPDNSNPISCGVERSPHVDVHGVRKTSGQCAGFHALLKYLPAER
jgi:hypothetical protein